MVGGDDLDGLLQNRAAEILHRHQRGFIGPFSAEIGIDARLVVQDADLHLLIGNLCHCGHGGGRHEGHGCKRKNFHNRSFLPKR